MRRRISRSVEDAGRYGRGRSSTQDPFYGSQRDRPRHQSEQRHRRRRDSWDRDWDRDWDRGRDDDPRESVAGRRSSRSSHPPLSAMSPRLGGGRRRDDDDWSRPPRSPWRSPRPDKDASGSPRFGSGFRQRDDPSAGDGRHRRHSRSHYDDDDDDDEEEDFERPRRRHTHAHIHGRDGDDDHDHEDRPRRRHSHSHHDDDFDRPRRRDSHHRRRHHDDNDDDDDPDDRPRRRSTHPRSSSADRYRPRRDRERDEKQGRKEEQDAEDEMHHHKKNLLKSILWGAAFQAGLGAALDMRSKPGPWLGAKGAKVATTAAATGLVDTFFNVKKPDRKGGIRHQAAKAGLTEGLGFAVQKAASRIPTGKQDVHGWT